MTFCEKHLWKDRERCDATTGCCFLCASIDVPRGNDMLGELFMFEFRSCSVPSAISSSRMQVSDTADCRAVSARVDVLIGNDEVGVFMFEWTSSSLRLNGSGNSPSGISSTCMQKKNLKVQSRALLKTTRNLHIEYI